MAPDTDAGPDVAVTDPPDPGLPGDDTGTPDADDRALIAEKVDQAREALADPDGPDCWLLFCRETDAVAEPMRPFVLDFDVVWPTAVVVGPERSAVVLGRHDAPNARELGVHDVVPYDGSIREPLGEVLGEVDPDRIAVDYSADDPVADGLTHGMYRRLRDRLPDPYGDRLESAESLVGRVRGVKSDRERDRIDRAVAATESLFARMADAYGPDWTERDVSRFLHDAADDRGYGTAWSRPYCPTVHAGGDAPVGHTLPGDRTVPEGELLHVDFGVTVADYGADLQRVFVRGDPPEGLRAAFRDVKAAVEAGRAALAPGVRGHEVDAAGRAELTDRGRPEFEHALGHQVGREAHDGGTLLGPQWDRYGGLPDRRVRAGEVYTLELGVDTEWGYVGNEEMVAVGEDGYLSTPQTALYGLSG